jgi:hypothetical protein
VGTPLPGFAHLLAATAAEPTKLRIASVSVPPSMHTLYMQVACGAKSIPVEAWADLKFQDEAVRQIGAIAE